MATRKRQKSTATRGQPRRIGPGCRVHPTPIANLGEFFNICSGVLRSDTEFWFRGHADLTWALTPSALRYETPEKRNRALNLLADFKRYVNIKLPHLRKPDDELQWVQLARHYGLPTRLLDWTRNAAIALYFACVEAPASRNRDGSVFVINPKDLNREADERFAVPRIFDAHADADRIKRYLTLSGSRSSRGLKTIAVNPVWNSERILLQQGAFTLHGSKEFTLTSDQVPSLVCLRVPASNKKRLLHELERAGINEMSIFPEPEHMCRYLVWRERLDIPGA
jgi:hypothetical protein